MIEKLWNNLPGKYLSTYLKSQESTNIISNCWYFLKDNSSTIYIYITFTEWISLYKLLSVRGKQKHNTAADWKTWLFFKKFQEEEGENKSQERWPKYITKNGQVQMRMNRLHGKPFIHNHSYFWYGTGSYWVSLDHVTSSHIALGRFALQAPLF